MPALLQKIIENWKANSLKTETTKLHKKTRKLMSIRAGSCGFVVTFFGF